MSAVDHEQAARSSADATGASPADHLAAAQQLRDEERSACAAVPDADRDRGPLARRDRITAVEEIRDHTFPKAPLQPFGVAVYLAAEPGLTEQWVGRVVSCYVAHRAVVGGGAQESPLLAPGARIHVSSTSVGFRISITSPDIDVARQVIRETHALVGNPS